MHVTTVDLSLRFLVFAQLKAVVERGGEAIGISAPGPWVAELESAGIRHVALPSSTRGLDPIADLRTSVELWRALRRERPDLVHTHNPKPGLYGRVLARLAGVPIVVNTVHGLYATEEDPIWKRTMVYVLEAVAARFSDVELVQSEEDFELLRRLRISPRRRVRYLGNGIDLSRFRPDAVDQRRRDETRRELGADEATIVVGMVGRLVAEKGYPELFEAARLLGGNYLVFCVGPEDSHKSDALSPKLVDRAQQTGVRFLGMRTDMVDLYAAMDLFVLPSHREGVPRAAMEAAAMGLPIVATNIRGCREVVDNGVNGLLVPVGSPGSLAAAIRELGEDVELRTAMGLRGKERALERFDERDVVAKVLNAYRGVARRRGVPWTLGGHIDTPSSIRRALPADAETIAGLHRASIQTGFLPRLGKRFLVRLYGALVAWPGSVVLVVDDGSGPGGFVAGVEDVGRFYRWFLRRHGLLAGLTAMPRLILPGNLRRAWETLRYQGNDYGVEAELLAMAVAPDLRGGGLGLDLGSRFLRNLSERGVDEVQVVVGEANRVALDVYRRMGFAEVGQVEVHRGERSKVLVWSASASPS